MLTFFRRNLVLLVLLLCSISLATCVVVFERLQADESVACKVQAQGLPAGRENVAILGDLHALLTLPASKAANRRAAQETPPAELAHERTLLTDLNKHLAAYQVDIARQPRVRRCAF